MTWEACWCYGIISTVPYEQQKIYRQILLFQKIYYLSISLTSLPWHREPSIIVLMSMAKHEKFRIRTQKKINVFEQKYAYTTTVIWPRSYFIKTCSLFKEIFFSDNVISMVQFHFPSTISLISSTHSMSINCYSMIDRIVSDPIFLRRNSN